MSKLALRSWSLGGTAIAFALATTVSTAPAHAQITGLYGGGATFPEKVHRDNMNCYGNTSGGETTANLSSPPATCNAATPYRSNVEMLYVGVGSGNGLDALANHDPHMFTKGTRVPDNPPVVGTTDLGSFFGAGVGAGWVPAAAGPDFPKVSFTGSDDPFTTAKLATFNTHSAAGHYGNLIQMPALTGAVTIGFKPAAGTWTEHGKKPAGGLNSSLVDFSTETWCGIYTGAITNWNDAAITHDNGNVQLGSGPITVVYRNDGSGTTFHFVNAFIHQCALTAHPVPASWQTSGGNASGVSNNNWFINLDPAHANLLPGNFVGAPGNGGIKATVNATAGAVGYLSTDFVLPVDPTGPKSANLQTYYTLFNGLAPAFKAASFKSANLIMSTIKAPLSTAASCPTPTVPGAFDELNPGGSGPSAYKSPDGICAHNPLNWGVANPTPLASGAFPIGGFTFYDLYTCYASAADVSAIAGTTAGALGYFRWYFGSATENGGKVKAALNANGFAAVPGSWSGAAKKLIATDKKTKIGTPGQANTGCSALVGGGA
jgi:ABC-type phosphate transport system substrate-binding protein